MTDLTPIMGASGAPVASGTVGQSKAQKLTRKQKAAIIVRLLANEGADVPLLQLEDDLQLALTQQMGKMRYVDRSTLADVVAEFANELDSIGLAFPGGLAGALSALDGKISPQTAARLRKEAGVRQAGDPWERIRKLPPERLKEFVTNEATEISAVLLSKIDTGKAAELLSMLPGPEARRITYAVSQTKSVTPDAVDRIGVSLASQLDKDPIPAFEVEPTKRVGDILNFSPSDTRESLLTELEEEDQEFAAEVRKLMFTFPDIPERVAPLDAGTILREADQADVITALTYANANGMENVVSHLLDNISKRLAEGMRDEMNGRGKIKAKEGEAAMNSVVQVIRRLEADGVLALVLAEEDAE
ncbi:flagellar motor switch protein FliG [Primorskyibacter sp. S187A]|uniref:flagellar motor switch protein FliG n=1 Tax=Primorskyibacter sp. S187A TaxID=3415130 RepID=UPI003C7BA344